MRAAEVVLGCSKLDPTVRFFAGLGFRLDAIFPADDPAVAQLSGHGLRLRLQRGAPAAGSLRLLCDDPAALAAKFADADGLTLAAPNGTRVELAMYDPQPALPEPCPELTVSRLEQDAGWQTGRAGMRYRDLIPGRQGGRFIASHIHIPDGGPVPDYVHYHQVRLQLIYCYKGWVKVVYEGQGEPFVMRPGDCVLQPPQIRHRVLESSPGLEVVEVSCPAEHPTLVEHGLSLPTVERYPERDFGGQRFVYHRAERARWRPWREDGFEARDFGIGEATGGLAWAAAVRPLRADARADCRHGEDLEFLFWFVLSGGCSLDVGAGRRRLTAGDACVLPGGLRYGLADCTDLELLEVSLPAGLALGQIVN